MKNKTLRELDLNMKENKVSYKDMQVLKKGILLNKNLIVARLNHQLVNDLKKKIEKKLINPLKVF